MDPNLQRLVDIEAIKALKARLVEHLALFDRL